MTRRILVWTALVTAVVALVAELLPEQAGTALTGGVATLFTLVMAEAALAARRLLGGEPSRFEAMLETPRALPTAPGDLERLRRTFGHKIYSQGEFEHRLRPELRRVAGHRFRGAGAPGEAAVGGASINRMEPELWAALYAEGSPDRRWKTQDLARLLDLIEEVP